MRIILPLVASACALMLATPAQASPGRITAVGDSYIAGIGAGSYVVDGDCRRSTASYAALVAQDSGAPFTDLSCPGATTTQALQQAALVPADSAVVLLQVGGNDVGFGDVAGACTIAGLSGCEAALAQGEAAAQGLLTSIPPVITAIQQRAPQARVVLSGYPRLLQGAQPCATSSVGRLLGADRVAGLLRLQASLDGVLRQVARSSGITFRDWPRTVDRHSLCSSSPWFVMPFSGDWADLLHPTAPAYRAYATALARVTSR